MLHLSRCIGFGVKVADLLEFQGPFVADGGTYASPDEKGVIGVPALQAPLLRWRSYPTRICSICWAVSAISRNSMRIWAVVRPAAKLAEQHGKQRQCRNLAEEALRGRHGYLFIRLDIDNAVAFAGNRTSPTTFVTPKTFAPF